MEFDFVETAANSGDRVFPGGQRLHHAWNPSRRCSRICRLLILGPKVLAVYMPWFGDHVHMDVGYSSDDPRCLRQQIQQARHYGNFGLCRGLVRADDSVLRPQFRAACKRLPTRATSRSRFFITKPKTTTGRQPTKPLQPWTGHTRPISALKLRIARLPHLQRASR